MTHDDGGYAGPAHVALDEREIEVRVDLRGRFEPLDGTFHWYGRVDPVGSDLLARTLSPGATVTVRTSYGAATGSLSDRDPWGRFRLAGRGAPPFAP